MGVEKIKVFGNEVTKSVTKKAISQKNKFVKKFKHDPERKYSITAEKNEVLGPVFGVKTIVEDESGEKIDPKKGLVIGTIRMGFGHYRISMAVASAAKAMGYTPYWFDLLSFNSTGSKVIAHLEHLYSLGSRLSQKSKLINKFVWEPMTGDVMKRIDYNAKDRKMCELFTDIYEDLPKKMPFVATHSWPAQAAVHAGVEKVVNMIPDNWPLALHFAEGSVHTIQTPSAYYGYRALKGMADKNKVLKPMPEEDIVCTGHYIDHEIVENIEADCKKRINRMAKKQPRRVLLSIGGAGAQGDTFKAIIRHLLPKIKSGDVALFLNMGDHKKTWDLLAPEFKNYEDLVTKHFDWEDSSKFAKGALTKNVNGIHIFLHEDIFSAVYVSNLLMRASDILMTKPSELAFYPIPKIFIQRVGGHEAWGAIHGAEIGDSTVECEDIPSTIQALELMIDSDDLLKMYCDNIVKNKSIGLYDGAYKVIELATGKKFKLKR